MTGRVVLVTGAARGIGAVTVRETPEGHLDLLWDVDVKGVWNTAAVTVPAVLEAAVANGSVVHADGGFRP